MTEKLNYKSLRKERKFDWFVGVYGNSLWTLAGIPVREYYLNPNACIEAYRKGRPLVRELFGDAATPPIPILSPMIKYGHVSTIGAKLNFPEGGEVHHIPPFASIDEGIKRLKETIDFAASGMTPYYLEFYKKLQDAFPDEKVHLGWQWEGPITTVWELLGANFMYDLFDKPDSLREFMKLSTAGIVEYCRFFCKIENTEVLNPEPDRGRLCDDIAAMVPSKMWPDFVLPFWNMFYDGPTPGRILHCEDMRAEQLEHLEKISIVDYDPGISSKLNPKLINEGTRVPFGWRLGGFHYSSMTSQDVEDFVYQAAADGASYVHTHIEAAMCDEDTAKKVRAFVKAAKETKNLFDKGASRDEIAKRVTPAGKQKFWNNWLGK